MKNKQTAMTIAVLANGAELCSAVAARLQSDATSTSLAGNELTTHTVQQTAQVVFQQKINEKIGAK